ncbi:MAG: hypothetical protein GEU92_07870 [Alphaproteobacteria bacterium]|nr:hypothetical protein [Alphaproteobacteria bacterium]
MFAKGFLTVMILPVAVTVFASSAAAEPECVPRHELVSKLDVQFSEAQKAVGLASSGAVVELFASPDGSWTLVATQPTGESCPIAAGEEWFEPDSPVAASLDRKL